MIVDFVRKKHLVFEMSTYLISNLICKEFVKFILFLSNLENMRQKNLIIFKVYIDCIQFNELVFFNS